MPTVYTQYPGDHTIFSLQYRFSSHLNFFLSSLLVLPFIFPTTLLTAYFGSITITTCIWSACMLYLTISHPGNLSITFGKSFSRYPFTPGFRMQCRYFGIHTMWYSVLYAACPDSLISTHLFYHLISSSLHSPTGLPVELCPSGY